MEDKLRLVIFIAIILAILAIFFSILVYSYDVSEFDRSVKRFIRNQNLQGLYDLLERIVPLASTSVMIVFSGLMVMFLFWKKHLFELIFFLTAMGGGVLITFVMKLMIMRERPSNTLMHLDLLGIESEMISYSYPSGHAIKALLFFGFMGIYLITRYDFRYRKLAFSMGFGLLVLMIGIGRIVGRQHFFSDVLGGYLIGGAWLVTAYIISRQVYLLFKDQSLVKKINWR